MEIRLATPADRDAVVTLLRAQFDERGQVLLAIEDGVAVGLAAVLYLWTLEHGGPAAWLDELFVVPERRDAGIGKRLLDAALATAHAHGALAVDLEVEADHERASHLYERAGFRRHRRTRWMRPLP